jgi:Putative zinc-finger
MRGHVDAESLALYAEGELSRSRAARVRAHLSGCPDCAATLAALAEVTTQLSYVPAPPMPSAVAARLDAALSAEAAHRAASAPAPAPAGAPSPRPPRRNPIWSPAALRILAGTAVTLVVAGGVGYAVSQFSGSPSSSASAPSRTAKSSAPSSGHRIHGGPFLSPGEQPNTSSPSGTAYAQTGTDYRRGTLAGQAKGELALYGVSGMSGPHQLAPAQVPGQVRTCARQLAHGHPLLFVDQARYQQRPAIVIVLGKPDTAVAATYSCAPLHSARLPVTSGPTTG